MLRAICRLTAVATVLFCIAVPGFAQDRPADWEHQFEYYYGWTHTYKLTPLEHKRLRAKGLTDDEIFAIANTARLTGRYVGDITQLVLAGETARGLAYRFNLSAEAIVQPRPEWKTEAWEEAVKRGDYFWIPPRGGK